MEDLLKCPFCGGDSLYKKFEINNLGDEIPVIFCDSCKVIFKVENDSPFLNCKDTYKYLEEKNIEAWNTRKPMEAVVAELEYKKEKYEEDATYWNEHSWKDLVRFNEKDVSDIKADLLEEIISIVRGKE